MGRQRNRMLPIHSLVHSFYIKYVCGCIHNRYMYIILLAGQKDVQVHALPSIARSILILLHRL
jgi:hypothetical protein